MDRLHAALRAALTVALAALLPFAAAAHNDSLRVYRCVGSNGTVALQDSPCRSGEQQVRDLQRPRDPPPPASTAPAAAAAPAPPAQAVREVRYVHVQPPQPMYECIDAEGDRYVSDSNEGNPRWVPLWTTAWIPGRGHRPRPWHEGGHGGGPGHRPGGTIVHATQVPAGNILVRDTCTALPQQEVCARLRDRRWQLDRRYNSALQGERDAIVIEQRGIDTRLGQDCRGR